MWRLACALINLFSNASEFLKESLLISIVWVLKLIWPCSYEFFRMPTWKYFGFSDWKKVTLVWLEQKLLQAQLALFVNACRSMESVLISLIDHICIHMYLCIHVWAYAHTSQIESKLPMYLGLQICRVGYSFHHFDIYSLSKIWAKFADMLRDLFKKKSTIIIF